LTELRYNKQKSQYNAKADAICLSYTGHNYVKWAFI